MGELTERESWSEPSGGTERAAGQLTALRAELELHRRGATGLDRAFRMAADAIAILRGPRAAQPADTAEARALLAAVPELADLVATAVGEAESAAHEQARRLWGWFGLHSDAPGWEEGELAGARALVACACAPLDERGPAWLRLHLLRLAARRWANVLTAELRQADEGAWRRSLGERYDTVRHRYAPRSTWRKRELAELMRSDERTVAAVRRRLTRWLADGGDFQLLTGELEAAFIEARTPSALA